MSPPSQARRWSVDDLSTDADIDRLSIFVPTIMSAGLVVSIVSLVRDHLHSRRRRGQERRRALAAHALAQHTLTGERPGTALRDAVRPRIFYGAMVALALPVALYVLLGATFNYLRPGGYVADIAWLWALSLLSAATLALLAAVSLGLWWAWPDPPRWAQAALLLTPLARRYPTSDHPGHPLLGSAALAAVTASALLTLVVGWSPHLVQNVDERVADLLTDWAFASKLNFLDVVDPGGHTEAAIVLALAVGVVTLRCHVFAGVYLGSALAGAVVNIADKWLVERPRPTGGVFAGRADSFPSGHLVQTTIMAGLLPIAVWLVTKRVWPARVVGGLLTLGVAFTAMDLVRIGNHWPTDVLGGVLVGAAIVLVGFWALAHREWHEGCRSCPWHADPTEYADAPEHRHRWRRGLVPLHPDLHRVVRWVARAWTVVAVGAFVVLAWRVGLPANPEGDDLGTAVEQPLQVGLLGLVTVGWLVAWRFEAAGAVLLALAGAGLGVVAAVAYHPAVSAAVAAVFLAPAVGYWLAWQHMRPLRTVVVLALVTTTVMTVSWAGADRIYDRYFGPAHPASSLTALPVESVEWAWSGAPSTNGATVVARLAGDVERSAAVELVVSQPGGEVLQRARASRPDDDRIVRWSVDGLEADHSYRYRVVVDGVEDQSRGEGWLRTFADGPTSLTVAFGSCTRSGSNGAVFDTIRGLGPDLYVATGDLHYGNIGDDDSDAFLVRYDDVLTAPAQAALYREVPVAYVWDDHDYGPNDADASSPSRDAARRAYRQAVPHAPLPAGPSGAIYQAFTVGRLRFVMTDTRSERTESSMLGQEQLDWLLDELTTASQSHALVVWVNPDPWIAPADPARDDWGGFADERREIADLIATQHIDNLVMVSGDAHMVALDDGTNSDYSSSGDGAGFPVLHAAALDRPGNVKGGPYSEGAYRGAGQFGTMTVQDHGGDLTVELAGWDYTGNELVSYELTVPPQTPRN